VSHRSRHVGLWEESLIRALPQQITALCTASSRSAAPVMRTLKVSQYKLAYQALVTLRQDLMRTLRFLEPGDLLRGTNAPPAF